MIVGVDNSDALVNIKKVNIVDNIVSTINRSKEGGGIIDIGVTPGTSNNSNNNTIESSIEPSKAGVGRKESDHTNLVADTVETRTWYTNNSLFDHTVIVANIVLESDSVSDTSIDNGGNFIHNTNLDLEKGSLCLVIPRFLKIRLQLMISFL